MTSQTKGLAAVFLAAVFFFGLASPRAHSREYRSVNSESHMISIQKNGQLDVALGDGTPVVSDVFPMIWFEGRDAPERLKTSGAWTERTAVQDALGDGQGIHHSYKGCDWSLRTYPTRPYFAAQSGFTNESKKPVTIKALFPWCVGEPGRGSISLGKGTDGATILTGASTGQTHLVHGDGKSDDVIAIFNPQTGRSLIAGFITEDRARTAIEIGAPAVEVKSKPSAFNRFRAGCYFDPPITLAPGETLYSEVLYLSFAEPEPVVGLQRYARAVQIANHRASPAEDAPVHAWIWPFDTASDLGRVEKYHQRGRLADPRSIIAQVLIGDFESTDPGDSRFSDLLVKAIRKAGYEPMSRDRFSVAPSDAQRGTLFTHQRMRRDGTTTRATDRFYFSPRPGRQSVWFDANDISRIRTDITAASMLRLGLLLPVPAESDIAAIDTVLQRVLPSPAVAARAVDLFSENPPRVLSLATKSIDGDTFVIAVLNWDTGKELPKRLNFAQLGLTPGVYFTVYDFWKQQYLGTASNQLDVSVPAGDATVLVLRPLLSHPMLAATGANLGQNWPALANVTWEPQARRFHVELGEAASTEASRRFTFAVPAPYRLRSVETPGAEKPTFESKGGSATAVFPSEASVRQGFDAIFEVAP